ncbi:MAG: DUF2786 domain-containing protein [Defluviitaleaceae bacterium]|nr:DUF2786 domain-containing protein [Defluviitaleaceae bacterium]
MANINSTLRKVKALAEGTSNKHERDAALRKFQELMELHGVSESDLEDETMQTHSFKWKGTREKSLLLQIMFKVIGSNNFTTYIYRRGGRKTPREIGLDCTMAQKLEIDFMFSFYKELYEREEKAFFHAFVQKHKLFGTPSDDGNEMSYDEEVKMRQLMQGMENSSPYKRIERQKD